MPLTFGAIVAPIILTNLSRPNLGMLEPDLKSELLYHFRKLSYTHAYILLERRSFTHLKDALPSVLCSYLSNYNRLDLVIGKFGLLNPNLATKCC